MLDQRAKGNDRHPVSGRGAAARVRLAHRAGAHSRQHRRRRSCTASVVSMLPVSRLLTRVVLSRFSRQRVHSGNFECEPNIRRKTQRIVTTMRRL